MDVCLLGLKESNKSRLDSYTVKNKCIDHIPYYLSGFLRAQFLRQLYIQQNADTSNSDNANSPLTRTMFHLPWISPQVSVIFTRLRRTRIKLEFPANLDSTSSPLIKISLKFTLNNSNSGSCNPPESHNV